MKRILTYGVIAGLIAGGALSSLTLLLKDHGTGSMVLGYLTMLVALSTVFIAIKQKRDVDGGGVIRFWPAFGLGIGITLVAAVLYVAAWEFTQMAAHMDFAADYSRAVLEKMRAGGASEAELAQKSAEMEGFKAMYANPVLRWAMTAVEILPVGLVVSLVSAALLRNSRFMPARA